MLQLATFIGTYVGTYKVCLKIIDIENQPRVLYTDSYRDSVKIVLCNFPA